MKRLAVPIVISASLCSAISVGGEVPAPDSKHYKSRFSFTLDLPQGFPACVAEDTNDGVDIFLSPAVRCDDENENVPEINVSGEYNVLDDKSTLSQLRDAGCNPKTGDRVEPLSNLTLSGRPTVACRIQHRDGGVDVWVGTIWKTDPKNRLAWIVVEADLVTRVDRLKTDFSVFQRTISTVKIRPDGTSE